MDPMTEELAKDLDDRGLIPIRWMGVVDAMDVKTGKRSIITVTSKDLQEWEFDGMASNAPYPWRRQEDNEEA